MTSPPAALPVCVEMHDITKSFGAVLANDHVSLAVRQGEVHALVGENGAGKTTLMKILFGLQRPDSGTITVFGRDVTIHSPHQAIALGIGMVHQHFMLLESLTVADNIALGHEPTSGPFLNQQAALRHATDLAERYGLKVDPRAVVRDISVGLRQRVEILKALSRGARILVLDEPTAVLTPQEVDDLFAVLQRLVASGLTVIFITHKLREVMDISQHVTVMRQGRAEHTLVTQQTSPTELARLMIGRDALPHVQRSPARPGNTVLDARGLWVNDDRGLPAVRDVSFIVRAGEIVGVAGVEGNGQSELLEALTGLRHALRGSADLSTTPILNQPPRRVREAGLAHIAEDRLKFGIAATGSIADNLAMGRHYAAPLRRHGILSPQRVASYAVDLIRRFDIRTADPALPARSLSGGNMQKVVVAREVGLQPRLLIAAQPTRGVDIGAIEYIHRQIVAERDSGVGVLLVSAELSEIIALSDRILVMYEGVIVGEFLNGVNEQELGLYMLGVRHMEAHERPSLATVEV